MDSRVFRRAATLAALMLFISGALHAQQSPDFERRLNDLERKMKELDPAFNLDAVPKDFAARLAALEERMGTFLAARQPAPAATPAIAPPTAPPVVAQALAPSPSQGPGLQPVSVSGDYQATEDTENRIPFAGYMDFHFNKDRGTPWTPDFHRFVLLFGHSFSNRIKFWSELELEHAFVEGGEETGEVALEQAYLDFLWKPAINFRAGMMLTPMGIVNERHEPVAFNGVERPFVETVIIPTTWREMGVGLTGDLGRGFRYRAYLLSDLNARFFDAENGISAAKTNGFNASFKNPAQAVRVEYGGVRRLLLGTSVYTGGAGFDLPGLNPRVTMFDVDGRYSFRRIDFRALYANTWVTKTAELNAFLERRNGINPNVAEQMRGYYFEPAFHLLPRKFRGDLIAFTRYEKYNTQAAMAPGYVPLEEFNRSSWLAGVVYKPLPDVALKFDYVWNRNKSQLIKPVDGINLGIGWWF